MILTERREQWKEGSIFFFYDTAQSHLSFGSRFTRQTLSMQTQRLHCFHIHHFHLSFMPRRHSLSNNSRMNLVNECLRTLLQRANVHHRFTVM